MTQTKLRGPDQLTPTGPPSDWHALDNSVGFDKDIQLRLKLLFCACFQCQCLMPNLPVGMRRLLTHRMIHLYHLLPLYLIEIQVGH